MGKRRTSKDICSQLYKDRAKLYRDRTKLINARSGKLTAKQLSANESKVSKLSSKIESFKSKIFKCGKRYAKIKESRTKVMRKINVLKNTLKRNHDMSTTERNKVLMEIQELGRDVRDLSSLMGMKLYEQGKGELSFEQDIDTLESVEVVVIWNVKQMVEGLIQSEAFKSIIIDGEEYNLEINTISAMFAIDDLIAEIAASQHSGKVRTPMLTITISPVTNTIKVSK